MKNGILINIVSHLATAQAGADKMSNDLRERAKNKWQKSKQLPRKAKKLMRKDALLDLTFAEWNDDFTADLFSPFNPFS